MYQEVKHFTEWDKALMRKGTRVKTILDYRKFCEFVHLYQSKILQLSEDDIKGITCPN